jgi:hypothetical protein
MTILSEALAKIALGEAQVHDTLTMIPLLAGNGAIPGHPGYESLGVALDAGRARVSEVSEGGSVPELHFVNEGDEPILLLDGEELVGAKQNRILNITILAPAHKEIPIPVSCVEAGRWNYRSRGFKSADRTIFAAARAKKAARVSACMQQGGGRRSNQDEVWDDIAEKSQRFAVVSDTGSAAAIYEAETPRIESFVEVMKPAPNQVGALFEINGRVVGLDLFDHPATLAAQLPKLVRGYALDALDPDERPNSRKARGEVPVGHAINGAAAQAFLATISAAETRGQPAVGLGEDLRLANDHLSGGALVHDGHVVHLCAFGQ